MRKARRVKNEEGVTLIILVVTIVVILILAGITVDVAFSENGIITSALGIQDKIGSEIKTDETEMNKLHGEIANGSIEGGGGLIPNSNSIDEGGEEGRRRGSYAREAKSRDNRRRRRSRFL